MSDEVAAARQPVPWFRVLRIAFVGLLPLSVFFALPIVVSGLVGFARVTFYPDLIAGTIAALAVAVGVFGLWLLAGRIARRPQLAADPPFVRALAWSVGFDLAFWAIVPALQGLPLTICVPYAVGASVGTGVYFLRLRGVGRTAQASGSA